MRLSGNDGKAGMQKVGPPEGMSEIESVWYQQGVSILRALAEKRPQDAQALIDLMPTHEAAELLARTALLPAEAVMGFRKDGIDVPQNGISRTLLQSACLAGLVASHPGFVVGGRRDKPAMIACAFLSHMLDICAAECIAASNAGGADEEVDP